MADPQEKYQVEIDVSDPSEQRSLRAWLERVPGVRVEQTAVPPGAGEQGAADVLAVLAGSSGVLAVAIRTLPEFIRSRRSNVTVTVKTDQGKEYTLHAENLNELPSFIEKMLDA
ncbi:hypothetical protein ACIBI9_64165 [Nonomuraea sp. NPDC050451]|uniref:effector-associated constant component EACC1 n=1 Tax=Nonomuraea sp. NPDC050451 TaxID=3364364 RepID=UPI0037A382C8